MSAVTSNKPQSDQTRIEIEAAVFRQLIAHLQQRTDVQNIDLMNISGFCRNCLSKWYQKESEERGHPIESTEARELIYGMPYTEWKSLYQKEATAEQLRKFKEQNST